VARRVRERPPSAGTPPVRSSTAESSTRPPTLLIDTNILLDLILARAPWDTDAVLLLDAVSRGTAIGFIAAHAVTTVYYVVQRAKSRAAATTAVSDLLQLLQVVALDRADFQRALTLGLADYEDAVQVAACLRVGADALVTRNPRDFKGVAVVTRSAGEVLALIATTDRAAHEPDAS
jgi:predicted nucleic acid-binding protein